MIVQDCGEGPPQEGKEVCSELRCPGFLTLEFSSEATLHPPPTVILSSLVAASHGRISLCCFRIMSTRTVACIHGSD